MYNISVVLFQYSELLGVMITLCDMMSNALRLIQDIYCLKKDVGVVCKYVHYSLRVEKEGYLYNM